MTEILDLLLQEEAFVQPCVKRVVPQHSQGLVQMLQVVLPCFGENENVIQVDQNEFAHLMLEDLIHHLLEGCWGICEAKAENLELEMSNGRAKCRLWCILLGDPDLVLALSQVN